MENTPTPITQSMRALMAQREALRLENRRLQDPALPDYFALWNANRKMLGVTAEQTLNIALFHLGFDETMGAPMSPDMCERFVEYAEGRARARVTEDSPHPSAGIGVVLAFRRRD
jgi:hypothetical protein